jgi:hypothetical protein
MNKIISFCLYGNKDLYCLGLIENIDIINQKYNNWKIYIYYNNIPEEILDIIKNKDNTYLFQCVHNGYNWEGMFWRFYPLESNNIDIFISRDADSRITDREMDLVNKWIESNKSFHIIRDHEYHRTEILGGTFGVNIKLFHNLIKNFKGIDFYKEKYYLLYDKNIDKQPDQIFLQEIIYPIIKNDNLTHISLESLRFSENDILIPQSSNFIGKPVFII